MILAVIYSYSHTYNREANKTPLMETLFKTLVNGRDIFSGDNTAFDAANTLIRFIFRGLHKTCNPSVLTGTTCLFLMYIIEFGFCGYGLTVCNLGHAYF